MPVKTTKNRTPVRPNVSGNMNHSSTNSIWNNQPLAALHQMTEMSSNPAANFLRAQQHHSLLKSASSSHQHQSGAGNSPPLGATPHGINDILNRNASAQAAALQAAAAMAAGSAVNAAANSRLFFNPQTMMSASTKHFQDLRSLYSCWPGMALSGQLAGKAGSLSHIPTSESSGGSDDIHDRRSKKNTRPTFSGHQIFALEKTFEQTKYLAGPERAKLAFALGMSESQVKVWFQNRRTKHRKRTAAENASHHGRKSGLDDDRDCDSDSNKSDCDQMH